MGRRVRTTVDPRKKKSRYLVKAPSYFFQGVELYEIPAADPELLMDRIVEIPLAYLRREYYDEKLNATNVRLQVKRVSGNYAFTEFRGLYVLPEYLRAKVRRGTSKIDAIITLTTSDGIDVRITTTVITAHRCRSRVAEDIRKKVFEYRSNLVPKLSFEELANFVTSDTPEQEIFAEVHKLFPISDVILAKVKVLSDPTERSA